MEKEKITVKCLHCNDEFEIFNPRTGYFINPNDPSVSYNKEYEALGAHRYVVPVGTIHLCETCRKAINERINKSIDDVVEAYKEFNLPYKECIHVG